MGRCGGSRWLRPERLDDISVLPRQRKARPGADYAVTLLRPVDGDADEPPRRHERCGRRPFCGRRNRRAGPVLATRVCRRKTARSNHEDPRRGQWIADRRRLAEGRRTVPWADQGQCSARRVQRRRVRLHGTQQPEPAQLPVSRLPQTVGGYTGASIKWIDLAQADYNARLQQSIATSTVDYDIIEMGAPFEGDVCGRGLARRCRTGSRSRSISTTMSIT